MKKEDELTGEEYGIERLPVYCEKADVDAGRRKIKWAFAHMPVLQHMAEELRLEKPLSGLRIAVSVHVEAKTACLVKTLVAAGAEVALTGCNPLSTQDDVAAALAADGVLVYCLHGADETTYRRHLEMALSIMPHLVIDDGGDFALLLHSSAHHLARCLIGGCEETTTGLRRLRILEREGRLLYPVLAINDARCKHLFDNRYGTGQSVWTAIMATTNLVVAGKTVVVSGYGMCGQGVAMRAKGLGARVVITEIDPVRACEALMEGYEVMPMIEAAAIGDLFITVTGCSDVITTEHFQRMKDGAILCNAGHFDVEINMKQIASLSIRKENVRPHIMAYVQTDGRRLYILGEGRLVNLVAGDGHPAEIMDMSFSLQTAGVLYLAQKGKTLHPAIYPLPTELDDEVARRLLGYLGKKIDCLTAEQEDYLNQWILS